MPNREAFQFFEGESLAASLEAALDIADMGAWGWDERKKTKLWTTRTKAIFGLPPDADVTRELFVSMLHPDDIPRYQAAWAAAFDPHGDRIYQLTYRIRRGGDGALRWISSKAKVEFEDDKPVRVMGAMRDITEDRETIERLRETERRFLVALSGSPVVTFEQDRDLRYTWVHNDQLGLGAERIVGKTDNELIDPGQASALEAIKRNVLVTGRAAREIVTASLPGEAPRQFDFYAEPVRDQTGAIVGISCAATDVTELRNAHEHVKMLLGEVNHRSKNLLAVIQAMARRTFTGARPDLLHSFTERIQALAANQDLLVRSEWKGPPLAELVRAQLAPFASNVAKLTIGGPDFAVLPAASQTLAMALHELATNAAKYGALGAGGTVEIGWSVDPARARFSMWWRELSALPPNPGPAGFGATVLRDVVRSGLDADIDYAFEPAGVHWRIDCPLATVADSEACAPAPAPAPTAAAATSPRVLVVEDEPLVALDLADSLREGGFTVVGPAHTLSEGLALLATQGCDVALLDVALGDATSEPIALELERLGAPFLTISGYSAEQRPEAFGRAPNIGKPIDHAAMRAEIAQLLQARAR